MKKQGRLNWILTIHFSVSLILLFTVYVHAYIDPSVMTYAIQAVAGIAISVGMFAGIYWRRIKKALGLGARESKMSILNDNLVFHDPDSGKDIEALSFMETETRCQLLGEAEKENASNITDHTFVPAVLLAVVISYLWMVYAPAQLQFSNSAVFKYDFISTVPALCLMFAAGLIAALLVYGVLYKLNKKLYTTSIVLSVIILLGTYIQGNFLVKNLQTLDGSDFVWSGHTIDHIQSGVLWGILSALFIILYHRFGDKAFYTIVKAICLILLPALIITNIASGISNGALRRKQPDAIITTEYQYTMSRNENFVIFVLDATAGEELRQLIENKNPEYKDMLRDFTFFPNTVSCYSHTKEAIPQILGGKWFEKQERYEDFVTKELDESPLFSELRELHYRMGMYEMELVYENDNVFQFENVIFGKYRMGNIPQFAYSNFCLMWYMYAPYMMKPLMAKSYSILSLMDLAEADHEVFEYENFAAYRRMKRAEIEVVDEPCFRFIHIEGAHIPYRFDKDVNFITEGGSYDMNLQAAMTITEEYLTKLRDADVYNDSAIIIMADHGYDEEENGIVGRENPIFLVKGRNESHEFCISEQPVSYTDLMGIYHKLLNGATSDQLIDYMDYEPRSRRYLTHEHNRDEYLIEYYQTGYASDESTMIPTGEVYSYDHPGTD